MRVFKIIIICGLLISVGLLIRAMLNPRNQQFVAWATGGEEARATLIAASDPCVAAPFILPSAGFVGLLWNDPRGPYSRSRRHQGIDIFTNARPGTLPVVAVADGFVYRESDWVSTVIQRIPSDPFQPEQQIWV